MCFEVKCNKCGKKTWAGCGMHKDSVMAKIPKDEQCICNQKAAANDNAKDNKKEDKKADNKKDNKKDDKVQAK